jgi:hypothetical protein
MDGEEKENDIVIREKTKKEDVMEEKVTYVP